jgi:hypothetical protein
MCHFSLEAESAVTFSVMWHILFDIVSAQCSGNAVLSTQTQLNGISRCRTFTGSIVITGSIADLASLSLLRSITDSLEISNTQLVSFKGLDSLNFVGESLLIKNNQKLVNSFGFQSLSTINGGLTIQDNPLLLSLAGFPTLRSINGNTPKSTQATGLTIEKNPSMSSLIGLQSLQSFGNAITLRDMNLQNLNGLDAADSFVLKNLVLENLRYIDSLNSLSFIRAPPSGINVTISGTSLLSSLKGLGLSSLYTFTVTRNAALRDLGDIKSSQIMGKALIDDNMKLCNLEAFETLNQRGSQIKNTCGVWTEKLRELPPDVPGLPGQGFKAQALSCAVLFVYAFF